MRLMFAFYISQMSIFNAYLYIYHTPVGTLVLIGGLNTRKAYPEGEIKYKGSTIRSRRSTAIGILILYVSLLYDSLLAFHMNSG